MRAKQSGRRKSNFIFLSKIIEGKKYNIYRSGSNVEKYSLLRLMKILLLKVWKLFFFTRVPSFLSLKKKKESSKKSKLRISSHFFFPFSILPFGKLHVSPDGIRMAYQRVIVIYGFLLKKIRKANVLIWPVTSYSHYDRFNR